MVEGIPDGINIRKNGKIIRTTEAVFRKIDFGSGPVRAVRFTWGDVFTAYYSTAIPDIENYVLVSEELLRMMKLTGALRPLFRLAFVRGLFKRMAPAGPTQDELDSTQTHVWGEVVDDAGGKAVARLHSPEAGVCWTILAALAVVRKVLADESPPGCGNPRQDDQP